MKVKFVLYLRMQGILFLKTSFPVSIIFNIKSYYYFPNMFFPLICLLYMLHDNFLLFLCETHLVLLINLLKVLNTQSN